jgi:hypothetical protein
MQGPRMTRIQLADGGVGLTGKLVAARI